MMPTILKKITSSMKQFFTYIFATGVQDTRKCSKCGRCMSGKKNCPR